jgi:hypothetical protein
MKFNTPVLQPRLNHSPLCPFDHLKGEIQSDDPALFANLVSRQNNVYPTAATEIHDRLSGLEVGKAGRIAATPRKVDADLRHQGKFFLPIKRLVNRIARTGLVFTRSTGLRVAAGFSKIAVACHNHLSDFLS